MLIHIFAPVYGAAYIEMFRRYALPSLMQAGNVPALQQNHDVALHCYTLAEDADAVRAVVEGCGIKTVVNSVRMMIEIDPRELQARFLIEEIKACLASDAAMIWCSADTIYGDWTLANLVHISTATNSSVSALYLRAAAETFAPQFPLPNRELATLALEHLHEVWRATVASPHSMEWIFGHSLLPLAATEFVARCQVPSVHVARFTKADLAYFMTYPDLRLWDHDWPSMLVSDGRLVTVGSTDIAMVCEPSPSGRIRFDTYRAMVAEHGLTGLPYQRRALHNEAMRPFLYGITTSRPVHLTPLFEGAA